MRFAPLIVLLFGATVCSASGWYSHLNNHEAVYIRHVNGRVQRSAEDGVTFPEDMTFTFNVNNKKVKLNMTLNHQQKHHVPVTLVTKNGTKQYNNDSPRDYSFYQLLNDDKGASVMVKCDHYQYPCHLAGSFRVGDDEYEVERDTNKPKLKTMVPHKIYKVNTNEVDYNEDTINHVLDSNSRSKNIHGVRNVAPIGGNEDKDRRQRRQTEAVNYKVELAMVIDHSVYEFWFNRMGEEQAAIDKIEEIYEHVANNMDLRFSSASTAEMTIDIILKSMTILQDIDSVTWIPGSGGEIVDATQALRDFKNWVKFNSDMFRDADAVMAFTREDLASLNTFGDLSPSTVGVANTWTKWENGPPTSSLCGDWNSELGFFSASLVEGSGPRQAGIAAHELAHTMGVLHDNALGCDISKGNIMAPSAGGILKENAGNNWKFSTCSIDVMQETMEGLLDQNKTCLQEHTYDVEDYMRIQNSQPLGKVYTDLYDQCLRVKGPGTRKCVFSGDLPENMCHEGIWCLNPGTNMCSNVEVMEGTSCGQGECYKGKCNIPSTTTSTTSPKTPTTTPTTTTSTPTTSTTTPTTTTTTPTTSTTTPTTTTTTPTTSTTTPTTSTTTPTPSTSTPTTSPTTATTTTTAAPECDFWCWLSNYWFDLTGQSATFHPGK